jgi:hypothetical protein
MRSERPPALIHFLKHLFDLTRELIGHERLDQQWERHG